MTEEMAQEMQRLIEIKESSENRTKHIDSIIEVDETVTVFEDEPVLQDNKGENNEQDK